MRTRQERDKRVTSKSKCVLIFLAAAVCFAGAIFFAFRVTKSGEPSYQGRSLSSWLEEFQSSGSETNSPAALAIRKMGTNALPFLLDVISAEKSSLRKQLEILAEQSPVRVSFLERNSNRRIEAADAINVLGTVAELAYPTLTNLFYNRRAVPAEIALAGIGQKGIQFLLDVMTNENSHVIFVKTAALTLGSARSDFDTVIPTLIVVLQTTNSLARVNAATSLGSLHQKPEIVIPVLMENLNNADTILSNYIISAIGEFGPNAKAAVPMLLKVQKSEDETIRQRAKIALQKISHESFENQKLK